MRRLGAILVLTLMAVGALSAPALAKEGGVELSSTPIGLKPGEPWTPQIRLILGTSEQLARAKPGVTIRNVDTGEELTYRAVPTKSPQVWDVRVVFPEGGWWLVESFDGVTGRAYPLAGQWYVERPPAAPAAPAPLDPEPAGATFPVVPVAAVGFALLLAAAGAALLLRRQRLRLSHET